MRPLTSLTVLNYQYLLIDVDLDTNKINEEFLDMVEVIGNKEALIVEFLPNKCIGINQIRCKDMHETNLISGECSALQRRFRHTFPYAKNVNCHNYKLALLFVHLLPHFKALQDVDSVLLSS